MKRTKTTAKKATTTRRGAGKRRSSRSAGAVGHAPRAGAKPQAAARPAPRGALAPPVSVLVNSLRRLVKEVAPQAKEQLIAGIASFELNGVFARISADHRQVLLEFLTGDVLDAPAGVLEGEGSRRYITFDDTREIEESVLRALLQQAVMRNAARPPRPR